MPKMKENTMELCAHSDKAELSRIRDFITSHALKFGFNEKMAMQVALAVDEVCSNLIQHAYKDDANSEICIRINHDEKNFIIDILDNADAFDPMSVPSPDMKQYFESYKRGGLGIQIIKKVMDSIVYIPANKTSKSNILSLIKKLQ